MESEHFDWFNMILESFQLKLSINHLCDGGFLEHKIILYSDKNLNTCKESDEKKTGSNSYLAKTNPPKWGTK